MDIPTFNAAMSIAEARHYPGISSGHTGMTPTANSSHAAHEGNKTLAALERIRDDGGMVSVILHQGGRNDIKTHVRGSNVPVQFDCGNSDQAWAQVYLYAIDHMNGGAVGIGSDFNGSAVAPRAALRPAGVRRRPERPVQPRGGDRVPDPPVRRRCADRADADRRPHVRLQHRRAREHRSLPGLHRRPAGQRHVEPGSEPALPLRRGLRPDVGVGERCDVAGGVVQHADQRLERDQHRRLVHRRATIRPT